MLLLYPYYSLREVSWAENVGLRGRPCRVEEKISNSANFVALTFIKSTNKFYAGNRIRINGEVKEELLDNAVASLLRKNPNIFLFGNYGGGGESTKLDYCSIKFFEYFDRSTASTSFNFDRLLSNSFSGCEETANNFRERALIRPIYSGQFYPNLDVFTSATKTLIIRFTFQNLVCKYIPTTEV